jgi:hypothetical protein
MNDEKESGSKIDTGPKAMGITEVVSNVGEYGTSKY